MAIVFYAPILYTHDFCFLEFIFDQVSHDLRWDIFMFLRVAFTHMLSNCVLKTIKESIGKIIWNIENIRLWDIGKVEQTDFFLQLGAEGRGAEGQVPLARKKC